MQELTINYDMPFIIRNKKINVRVSNVRSVLVVMPLGEFGGGAEQMLATYLSSRSNRDRVLLHFLFLSSGGLADYASTQGYPVKVIEVGRMRQIHKWIKAQRIVSNVLEHWLIDGILLWMPKAGSYVALPARKKGIPMYMWRHDIPWRLSKLEKWVMNLGRIHNVACSSQTACLAMRKLNPSVSSMTIHPATHQLPFDARRVSQIRESMLSGCEGPVMGTIARLQPWKRIDLFLRAASLLKRVYPGLCVVVVGGESHGLSRGYGENLKRLGAVLLGEAVHFVGEQRPIGDWLEAMDIFVLASEGEPFGIVLIEALAAGKPIVACAGGGPEEIIGGDTVGRVLNRNPTPKEMADAMKDMLDGDVLKQAREINPRMAERFSPENMAEQIDSWLTGAP